MTVIRNKKLLEEYRNLEGKQFGHLTVLSCHSDKSTTRGFSNLEWLCRCKCGKEKFIKGYLLVYGLNKSCGCSIHSPRVSHIGDRIGHLIIIGKDGDNWVCRCDCGKEVLKPKQFISRPKSSTIPDCGNHNTSGKHNNLINDLIGLQFGDNLEWEVIERDFDYTGKHVRYLCKNKNTGEVKSQFSFYILNLKKKDEKNEILNKDLTSYKSGDLTVIRRFTESHSTFFQYYNNKLYRTYYRKKKKYPQWVCQCTCGNLLVLTSKDIIDNGVTHCGCKGNLKDCCTRTPIHPRKSIKDTTPYVGLSLGWLKVIKEVEDDHGRQFLCRCKCGREKVISLLNLKTGVCSCGCLKRKENRGNKESLLKKSRESLKKWKAKNHKL